MERVTPQDSQRPPPGSADDAVLFDGLDKILTARGREPARRTEQRADEALISPHEADHHRRDCSPNSAKHVHNASPCLAASNRFATRRAVDVSECR